MPDLKRSIALATSHLTALEPVGPLAEAFGLHRVWSTEFQGRDALSRSLAIGASTRTLHVGTGVAYAFTRAPRALAAAALDVSELTQGRFTLGLGAGTRGLRRSFGVDDFDPPATRLAQLIGELRKIWAEPDWERPTDPPPIAAGGVNEAMLAVAAHHADRVLLHPLCLVEDHLQERVLPALVRGADRREDGPGALSAWCISAVDDDPALARERARRQAAFYLSTPAYRHVLSSTPWDWHGDIIRREFAAGQADWTVLARHVPDALLDQISVSGDPSTVGLEIDRMCSRLAVTGVDELVLQTTDSGPSGQAAFEGVRQLISSASIVTG